MKEKSLFGEKKVRFVTALELYRMPWTDQLTEIAPYIAYWATVWYKNPGSGHLCTDRAVVISDVAHATASDAPSSKITIILYDPYDQNISNS